MRSIIKIPRMVIVLAVILLLAVLVNRIYVWGNALAVSTTSVPTVLPLVLLSIALGTDAMSMAIGIGMRGVKGKDIFRVSSVIGLFHVIMPLLGIGAGIYFGQLAGSVAHWVGAAIVAYIGLRMIWGCLKKEECDTPQWKLVGWPLLILALGVSIDALSVGFGLGTFGYNIYVTALTFGVFSALMTAVGLYFGGSLGRHIGNRGELVGGCVLVVLALHMAF